MNRNRSKHFSSKGLLLPCAPPNFQTFRRHCGGQKQTNSKFWQPLSCLAQTLMPTFKKIGFENLRISSTQSSTSFKQGCLSCVIFVFTTSSKALSGVNSPTRIPNHVQFHNINLKSGKYNGHIRSIF